MNKTYYPHWKDGQFAKVEYLNFTGGDYNWTDQVFECLPIKDFLETHADTSESISIIIRGKYTSSSSSNSNAYWIRSRNQLHEYNHVLDIASANRDTNNQLYLVYNKHGNVATNTILSAPITSSDLINNDFKLDVNFHGTYHTSGSAQGSWSGNVVCDFYVGDTDYTYYPDDEVDWIQSFFENTYSLTYGTIGGGTYGRIYSIEVKDLTAGLGYNAVTLYKLTPAKDKDNDIYGFYEEVSKQFFPLVRLDGNYTTTGQGPIVVDNWK